MQETVTTIVSLSFTSCVQYVNLKLTSAEGANSAQYIQATCAVCINKHNDVSAFVSQVVRSRGSPSLELCSRQVPHSTVFVHT